MLIKSSLESKGKGFNICLMEISYVQDAEAASTFTLKKKAHFNLFFNSV